MQAPYLENSGDVSKAFVGRQPIFNAGLRVHAYELLYRRGDTCRAGVVDGDAATCSVIINTLTEIGLGEIVGERRAFINLTRRFLIGDHPISLPPERFTLEILEDVPINRALLDAIAGLRKDGFELALDDYDGRREMTPLLAAVDIVKVDLMRVERSRLARLVGELKRRDLRLVAEKIETRDDFERCVQLGFDYFQGYFLCKPNVVSTRRIAGNRLAILQVLAKLQDPTAELEELVNLISQNVTLSYKILRYVNSAYVGLVREISSIRQATIFIGQKTIRNLAALMTLGEIDDKPDELIRLSMVRAHMCAELAKATSADEGMFFTVGLFSTLDALLDTSMPMLMESLPLSAEVRNALIHRTGAAGHTLSCVTQYERGEWEQLRSRDLDQEMLTACYLKAIKWADTLFAEGLFHRPQPTESD